MTVTMWRRLLCLLGRHDDIEVIGREEAVRRGLHNVLLGHISGGLSSDVGSATSYLACRRCARTVGRVEHSLPPTEDPRLVAVANAVRDEWPGSWRNAGQSVEVMPVAEHEEIVARLADWIETNCEGVQVHREIGMVVT